MRRKGDGDGPRRACWPALALPLALAGLVLAAAPSAAQIPALCGDAPNQAEATQCAAKLLDEADAALDAAYVELLASLPEAERGFLSEAEAAWTAFRDKECVNRTGGGAKQEGTIWPMMTMECQVGMARQRIEELAYQLKCPHGGLAC